MRVFWYWLEVLGKDASDDIFVDLDLESKRNDVGDSWSTVAGITLLLFDDCSDKLPRGTFGPGRL